MNTTAPPVFKRAYLWANGTGHVAVQVCDGCGAVVWDLAAHLQWHEVNDRAEVESDA